MMSHSEPQQPCPKCGQVFPQSQMFSHWSTCKGSTQPAPLPMPQQFPAYNPQPHMIPIYPVYQAPPVHKHSWIENDSYKWCLECRALSLKLRGTWFLFVRYGLKFIWIIFLLDLILALGLVSYFHIAR